MMSKTQKNNAMLGALWLSLGVMVLLYVATFI
jgi:hypothetical protein